MFAFAGNHHAFDYSTEGRKSHVIEVRIVGPVDEYLRTTRVGPSGRKTDGSTFIRVHWGIICDHFPLKLGEVLWRR